MRRIREFRQWHREHWSPVLARELGWLPIVAAFLCLVTVIGWPFDSGSRIYIPSIFWERETVQAVCESVSHVPSTHHAQVWIVTQDGGQFHWVYGDEIMDEIHPGDDLMISYQANHPFADVPIVRGLSASGRELLNWECAAHQEDEAAMGYVVLLIGSVSLSLVSYYAVMWRRFCYHQAAEKAPIQG